MTIELTLNNVRLLGTRDYGYYGSGVFPKTTSYFYRAEDDNQKVYTISTTSRLMTGDKIRVSVKGESIYNGERQTNLNRVKFLSMAERPFGHIHSPNLSSVISTEGSNCGW